MATDLDDIAVRLRKVREGKKITQAQLAEMSGIHANTIYRIESGLVKAGSFFTTLKLLADALGVTVIYLATGKNESEEPARPRKAKM